MATGTVEINWVRDELFVGFDRAGRSLVIGRSGTDEVEFRGVKASDLLLLSLISCSGYDVAEILQKQRQCFTDLRIYAEGVQDDEPPWRFNQIHIRYKFKGQELNENMIRRAIELSQEKYCSVFATLRSAVSITSEYEIMSE